MTAPMAALAPRHRAMLRAVAAGRAELTVSRVPDLFVDGRCCTDHGASAYLAALGLITTTAPAVPAAPGGRVLAVLTPAGVTALATDSLRCVARSAALTVRHRPGGPSAKNARQAGSPTHHVSSEGRLSMLRTTDPVCRDLGCDWAWDTEPCDACGWSHTYRVCGRCLTAGDDPQCPTPATATGDLDQDPAVVLVLIPAADAGAGVAA
jgi:hypothetical protein